MAVCEKKGGIELVLYYRNIPAKEEAWQCESFDLN